MWETLPQTSESWQMPLADQFFLIWHWDHPSVRITSTRLQNYFPWRDSFTFMNRSQSQRLMPTYATFLFQYGGARPTVNPFFFFNILMTYFLMWWTLQSLTTTSTANLWPNNACPLPAVTLQAECAYSEWQVILQLDYHHQHPNLSPIFLQSGMVMHYCDVLSACHTNIPSHNKHVLPVFWSNLFKLCKHVLGHCVIRCWLDVISVLTVYIKEIASELYNAQIVPLKPFCTFNSSSVTNFHSMNIQQT